MVDAVVEFLVSKLASLLQQESDMLLGVRAEAEYIRDELERMTAFLRVSDGKEDADPQLKIWVRQVREVAYDTDDFLDEFILRLPHQSDGRGFYGCLRTICYSVKKLKARHQVASKIRELRSRVSRIAEGNQRYNIPLQQNSMMTTRQPYNYSTAAILLREAEIVGIEKPKQQLLKWLVDDGHSGVQCISVVGMGGLGKTTLVKKVYDDPLVKKHFQSHLWLVITQTPNLLDLLRDIVQQLFREINQPAPQGVETMNEINLKDIIDQFLQQRKYILVIDDVWQIRDWDAVKDALPDSDCGSRLMLTTRSVDIASASQSQTRGHVYTLEALSPEDSWALFCSKAFPAENYLCPPHLQEISRIILRRCEGLPLAIVVVGGALCTKDKSRIDDFEKFHQSLPAELEGNQRFERLKKILSVSYYDLPYHLKICFLYMSLFPENKQIDNITLFRMWVAQGFVQERGGMAVEDVAEGYLFDLVNRSLVQMAFTVSDGMSQSCRIHDMVREIILLISREQKLVSVLNGSTTNEMCRHLGIHESNDNVQVSSNYFTRLHSFVMFDSQSVKRLLPLILSSSKFLKVLDLKGAPLDVIPDEIFGLLHLKYLSLKETKVKILPKLIENLKNLETLNLKETDVTCIPSGIVKLVRLRNLIVGNTGISNLRNSVSDIDNMKGFKAPFNIGALISLEMLWCVEVDDEARGSGGESKLSAIGRLTELRTLSILNLRREDGITLCSSIVKLTNLRQLFLLSKGKEEFVDLESLSTTTTTTPLLPLLRTLTLRGRLQKVPDWISSLQHLGSLCLCRCSLNDGSGLLGSIENLPNLVLLWLQEAYNGESLCFKAGKFQRLRDLYLMELQGLKCVRVEEGAMPVLDKLWIASCPLLDSLPIGIEHLTNLWWLHLAGLPQKLIDPLLNEQGGDYTRILHIPEVWIADVIDDKIITTHYLFK